MDNFRQRFFFPDTDLRGDYVQLTSELQPVLGARQYPLEIQGLLGEALAAVCLLTGTLKFDGYLSLQAQGKGELNLLLAEATHNKQFRGVAHWQADYQPTEQPKLAELLGSEAVMAITLHPAKGNAYQSLVPLQKDTLAACLGDYFEQSEQLPTKLWLACGNGRASGLLLQRLPNQEADEAHNADQWQTLQALADTLSTDEMLSLPANELLHRLFHELSPTLPEAEPLQFACRCSREKVEKMLLSLGREQLQSLLDEKNEADIECDVCRQNQHFDAVDLQQLIQQL